MEFALAGFAGEGEFLFEGVGFCLPPGLRFGAMMGGFGAEFGCFRTVFGGFRAAGALGAVEFGEGAGVLALPIGAVVVDLVEGGVMGVGLDEATVLVVDVGEDGGGVAEAFASAEDLFAWKGFGVVDSIGELFEADGFGLIKAGERPAALGEVLDGEALATGEGLVDLSEFGEKLGVEIGVFVAEDGVALDG